MNKQTISIILAFILFCYFLASLILNLEMYTGIKAQRAQIEMQTNQIKAANDSLILLVRQSQSSLSVMSSDLAKIKANASTLQQTKDKQAKEFNANVSALNGKLKEVNEKLNNIVIE